MYAESFPKRGKMRPPKIMWCGEVYWIRWLAAVVLVEAEMISNTFYLIAVALISPNMAIS